MMVSKGQRLPADTGISTHVPLLHLVYGRLVSQTLLTKHFSKVIWKKWQNLIIIVDDIECDFDHNNLVP